MTSRYWQSLIESLSGSIAKQATHNISHLNAAVPALAAEYGMDYAGEEVEGRMRRRYPKFMKKYSRAMKHPKQRSGRFVSDLSSLGGVVGGIKLGGMRGGGKLRQAAGAVVGHMAGRLAGNYAGKRVNKAIYRQKKLRRKK
jgi:hypothetical protein